MAQCNYITPNGCGETYPNGDKLYCQGEMGHIGFHHSHGQMGRGNPEDARKWEVDPDDWQNEGQCAEVVGINGGPDRIEHVCSCGRFTTYTYEVIETEEG